MNVVTYTHLRHGGFALVSRSRFGRQGGYCDGRKYRNRLRNRQGSRQDHGSSRHSGVSIGRERSVQPSPLDHACTVHDSRTLQAIKKMRSELAEAKPVSGEDINVEFMALDLASLASARDFAKAYLARSLPLHLLILNAGMAMLPLRIYLSILDN